jgi:hypothetical protein
MYTQVKGRAILEVLFQQNGPPKSSEAPMRFLWAFRYNPGCMGEQRICNANS